MSAPAPAVSAYRRGGKRLLDLALAAPLALAVAPLVAVLAVLVRLTMGAPVLYRQQRPGLDGRPFALIKLRTMVPAAADATGALADEARLTPVGRVLRRWSLDELPELWNVLRGDMSLVGPRPLLMEYLDVYDERQRRRHDVRPGLTGWAQVHGRNEVPWKRRLEMDVWYTENVSLRLDLIILARTVSTVVRGRGVGLPVDAEMPRLPRKHDER